MTRVAIISIVDDDESFRRAAANFVDSLGYSVETFSSAEEFLRSPRLSETACLISDVQMPGMSGVELQDRLLADGYRVPVVFVTAYPETKASRRALASGALGVLNKPFSEAKLISYLDQAVAGRSA